jgi:hypothetical protein
MTCGAASLFFKMMQERSVLASKLVAAQRLLSLSQRAFGTAFARLVFR